MQVDHLTMESVPDRLTMEPDRLKKESVFRLFRRLIFRRLSVFRRLMVDYALPYRGDGLASADVARRCQYW